jgi:cobalt/nickel transport system permease protein
MESGMNTKTIAASSARPTTSWRARLNAKEWLGVYLAAVVAITFVHDPLALAVALVSSVALSGAARWKLLRRASVAVLAFNLSVSIGYVIVALWQDRFSGTYLLLVNLRVLLLVFLGFWFVSRVNLLEALAFSRTLSFIAALAVGQVVAFTRIIRDFRLAFISRNSAPASMTDRARHASAQASSLLDKSVCGAAETAMAMRSRGCFDD